MATQPIQQPVFDFMVVRPPDTPTPQALRSGYVHDDGYVVGGDKRVQRVERDVHTAASGSEVGRLVHGKVFCEPEADDDSDETRIAAIVEAVFGLLPVCADPCVKGGVGRRGPILEPFPLERLGRWTWVEGPRGPVILPDRLDRITDVPLIGQLADALVAVDSELALAQPDMKRLVTRVEKALGSPVYDTVFAASGAYTPAYTKAKKRLFDTLYILYVLCRALEINLEGITDGLRALHLMEALALDALVARSRAKVRLSAGERALLSALGDTPPWRALDIDAVRTLRAAVPVVHPIFAELCYFKRPFNPIREIGVGELKVVRQRLIAYRPGEISHVHNILMGETKTRDHKRTESSEDTFTFTRTGSEETSRDVQTTQRFELKAEAESVVSSTLGVNANANVSYQSTPVVASLSAGFSYNKASEDTKKTVQNFARDVVDKAVSRIQEQTTSARTSIVRAATEEHNQQVFDNKEGKKHVSGMYRWIDKVYEAQVYTYGKRLMYEFLIPQPAAFWADSVLRAYSAQLRVPQPPLKPTLGTVTNPGGLNGPQAVTAAEYQRLRVDYDLDALRPPAETKSVPLRNKADGGRHFAEKDLSRAEYFRTYDCTVAGAAGYSVTMVHLDGNSEFHHKRAANGLALRIENALVDDTTIKKDEMIWPLDWDRAPVDPIEFTTEEAALQLRFHEEIKWYDLAVTLDLKIGTDAWSTWQAAVFKVVKEAEERKVAEANEKKQVVYERALADYQEQIDELKATTVGDLLAGTSTAANKALMDEEIKKHCLTMITKEFDADDTDDLLSRITATKARTVKPVWTLFKVDEKDDFARPTTAGFVADTSENRPEISWPAIDIGQSRKKGRTVQFLEQAFEWQHLSYLFYPYYWAEEPRWIELMHRRDDADPAFTAFLRAGMARVLVAVTPGYDCAVMTYLKCRTPWGRTGVQPVVDGPLFVPLFEEVRAQTDDRFGGKPDGEPWRFTVPTTLVYLHNSGDPLPDLEKEARRLEADEGQVL